MGRLKSIIKDVILNEAAGISPEVRVWVSIIEKYVEQKQKEFRKENPIKSAGFGGNSYRDLTPSYGNYPQESDGANLGYTHFEYMDNENIIDTAYIYGDDLQITPDVLDEFPNIEKELSGKLYKIYLSGDGSFDVTPARGSYVDDYSVLPGIVELVEDHAVMNQPFYDLSYEFVFAVQDYESFEEVPWYEINESWTGGYNIPKLEKIVINGKDFPEAYENFKVDRWVINDSNRIEYDHWKSGYNEEGEYVVYLNMSMFSISHSSLVHEIKHAYDDWNRMSRGAAPIRDSWEIKNIYTKDFEKLVLGGSLKVSQQLHPIIRYYYLGSKLETPAYLENEYDSSVDSYRDIAKKLINFKASNYLNKKGEPAKGLQESWENLLIDYDIPLFRKFPNVVDFLRYTEKYFNKRGRDIIKRIDKMRYVHDRPVKTYNNRFNKNSK